MSIITSLQTKLGRNTWPDPTQVDVWEEVAFFAALRESTDALLRMQWSVPWNYPYIVTPVPRMLSRASAGMLFGEPPTISYEDQVDNDRIQFIVDENDLPAELHRAAVMSSSEGDVFGRINVRTDLLDAPIIEYVSRARVIPRFSGRFLTGATFITQWQEGSNDFVRLFEHYEPGVIRSELYRGTRTGLGAKINLASYSNTENIAENVYTGIPQPLAVFVPNSIDADPTRGYGDYRGLEERFRAINDATTIGAGNVKLAGKKRALIDGDYVRGDKKMPLEDDVWVNTDANKTLGEGGKPLQMLEYDFDASAIVSWIDHLLDSTIFLAGMSPESVGRHVDGGAISGTALRLKMTHTLIEESGKGRFHDRGARQLLRYAAMIDARPTIDGGFGRKWTNRDPGAPSFQRADALPRDDQEAAQRLVLLTNANAISTEEKVRVVHPDWDEEQIAEEVKAIDAAAPALANPEDVTPPIETPRPPLNLPTGQ